FTYVPTPISADGAETLPNSLPVVRNRTFCHHIFRYSAPHSIDFPFSCSPISPLVPEESPTHLASQRTNQSSVQASISSLRLGNLCACLTPSERIREHSLAPPTATK